MDPTVWPKTLMGPEGSPADKEEIGSLLGRLQILGQSFCTKWGENISIGSWTNQFGKIFLPIKTSMNFFSFLKF